MDKRAILVLLDYALLPFGLTLLGIGLWMYAPWVSLTVVGAVIVFIAVAIELLRRK